MADAMASSVVNATATAAAVDSIERGSAALRGCDFWRPAAGCREEGRIIAHVLM